MVGNRVKRGAHAQPRPPPATQGVPKVARVQYNAKVAAEQHHSGSRAVVGIDEGHLHVRTAAAAAAAAVGSVTVTVICTGVGAPHKAGGGQVHRVFFIHVQSHLHRT